MKPEQVWAVVLDHLRMDLPRPLFDSLVTNAKLIIFQDGLFVVGTASESFREQLEDTLTKPVKHILEGVLSRSDIEVRFVVDKGPESPEKDSALLAKWDILLKQLKKSVTHDSADELLLSKVSRATLRMPPGETLELILPRDIQSETLTTDERIILLEWVQSLLGVDTFILCDWADAYPSGSLDPADIWRVVVGTLRTELPPASFDTWVRDMVYVNCEDGQHFTVQVRNDYAKSWLETKLSQNITHLLSSLTGREDVTIKFVTQEIDGDIQVANWEEEREDGEEGHEEDEEEDQAETFRLYMEFLTEYDAVVSPQKIASASGYLLRLLPEIGSNALFSYVGFNQVGWMTNRKNRIAPFSAPVVSIAKFSGMNRTAFHKLMTKDAYWERLKGLVERTGDGYIVHQTLPLSAADAHEIRAWLTEDMSRGNSLTQSLTNAFRVPPGSIVGTLISRIYEQKNKLKVDYDVPRTVSGIARQLAGQKLSAEENAAAEKLHVMITSCFKPVIIRHYFLTRVIKSAHLSPDQAALVVASRYKVYANPDTGEVSNSLIVKGGLDEMAAWVGIKRPKTIWEWLAGSSRSSERGCGIPGFIMDVSDQVTIGFPAKALFVRLLEPIHFGDGWQQWTEMEDREKYILGMRQNIKKDQARPEESNQSSDHWNMDAIMTRTGMYPNIQEKLKELGTPDELKRAWILWIESTKNTSRYALNKYIAKVLQENPKASPGAAFERLAKLPPSIMKKMIEATPRILDLQSWSGTGIQDWDENMVPLHDKNELFHVLFG